MEIAGKIIQALEPRVGTSQRSGNPWKVQSFVIETHEQYPKRCVFDVFGEDRLREFNIQAGEELVVSFDIDAHEYQGRWYNSVRAWRVQRGTVDGANPIQQAATTIPSPTEQVSAIPSPQTPAPNSDQGTTDDLPF